MGVVNYYQWWMGIVDLDLFVYVVFFFSGFVILCVVYYFYYWCIDNVQCWFVVFNQCDIDGEFVVMFNKFFGVVQWVD